LVGAFHLIKRRQFIAAPTLKRLEEKGMIISFVNLETILMAVVCLARRARFPRPSEHSLPLRDKKAALVAAGRWRGLKPIMIWIPQPGNLPGHQAVRS
jgi:hypothetical protein